MLITYGGVKEAFSVSVRYALRSRIEAAATEIAENVDGIHHLTLSVHVTKLWHLSIGQQGVPSLLALIRQLPLANAADGREPHGPLVH
jgi:hypothetical protein